LKYWREPLDLKDIRVPHGEIHVLTERCKGCGWCIEFCRRGVLEVSDEINSKGYHPPHAIQPDACVSWGPSAPGAAFSAATPSPRPQRLRNA